MTHPILLCFDGSANAAAAIPRAAELVAAKTAVVLTVWEPLADWEPYDPATLISSPLAKLASGPLGLDEIARDLAREKLERGVSLAREAGLEATGRVAEGKPWQTICRIADEIDAEPIVLGARGLSRVGSMFLGSVSFAVVVHARRPVLVIPPHEDGD